MSEPFEGWALIEQMGHKSIAGYVREVQLAGVSLLRVDVPGPKAESTPIASQYIHASSLYALTPMAEEMVRRIAGRTHVDPPAAWGASRALPAPEDLDDDPEFDDRDDDDVDLRSVSDTELVEELLASHRYGSVLAALERIRDYLHAHAGDEEDARQIDIIEHAQRLLASEGVWPHEHCAMPTPPPAPAFVGADGIRV